MVGAVAALTGTSSGARAADCAAAGAAVVLWAGLASVAKTHDSRSHDLASVVAVACVAVLVAAFLAWVSRFAVGVGRAQLTEG